jgi:hypothetical protein
MTHQLHEEVEALVEAIDWAKVAKKLLDRRTGKGQDDLYYRAYLRAIIDGKPAAHLVKKFAGAKEAHADLVDYGGMAEASDDQLTQWAKKAFQLFRDDPPRERAMAVATTVGRQAKRQGMDEKDVLRWLQSAYGNVWVKMGSLNPGADLKEIAKAISKVMR